MVLCEGKYTYGLDVGKMAKECLKNLSSEDLFQLSSMDGPLIREYESTYTQI